MSDGLDLVAAVEALLFAAPEPLTREQLAQALGVEPPLVEAAIRRLADHYEAGGHGIELRRVAGGYRLATRPRYAPAIRRLSRPRRVVLSHAALETLAIIAYRQPITRAEIEHLRGVSCESPLATLLEHGLVEEVGRKDAPGRPILYGTTRRFLEYLGLGDIRELPPLPEGGVRAGQQEVDHGDGGRHTSSRRRAGGAR